MATKVFIKIKRLEKTVIARKVLTLDECEIKVPTLVPMDNWLSFPWSCFLCNHRTLNYTELQHHMQKVHRITKVDEISHVCVDCGKFCEDYVEFINHVRAKHHEALRRRCDVCNQFFSNYHNLSTHRKLHLTFSTQYPAVHHCCVCAETFSSFSNLSNHKKRGCSQLHGVTKVVPPADWKCEKNGESISSFKCTFCDKTFEKDYLRRLHEFVHSGRKHLLCPRCSKGFLCKRSLRKHIQMQTVESSEQCEICPEKFNFRCQLKMHMVEHQLKCYQCFKVFACKKTLMIHLRNHEVEKLING